MEGLDWEFSQGFGERYDGEALQEGIKDCLEIYELHEHISLVEIHFKVYRKWTATNIRYPKPIMFFLYTAGLTSRVSANAGDAAITGDSVVMKFEKARSALEDGLRRVEDIVPQTIGCQISNILHELEGIEFSLDPIEKQTGDKIIGLLQQEMEQLSSTKQEDMVGVNLKSAANTNQSDQMEHIFAQFIF
ncbi:hypothetical protein Tco_0938385 [Tanacetum coccineum]|uniref:Uncharacterized protein n=1 Tax=Tanacetum coccineum TaxID=301880 RepID=A0ABQ5DH08_9ASTR